MDQSRLHGEQYVRLAPGAALDVARHLAVSPAEIDELVLDLDAWPEEIRPMPVKGRDGRLIAGDPVLLGVNDAGLLLAGSGADTVLVGWARVKRLEVLS